MSFTDMPLTQRERQQWRRIYLLVMAGCWVGSWLLYALVDWARGWK